MTIALALACLAAPAPAGVDDGQGPTTVNPEVVRDLLTLAQSRRIDVVCLGDSNQLFSGAGWQDGWTVALGERYPMYATPLFGAGSNKAIGIAMNVMAAASLSPAGAPPGLLEFNDPGLGVDATPYGFLPEGETILAGSFIGLRLRPGADQWSQNNFNAEHALRAHFDYGTFESGPSIVFQPQFIQGGSFNISHDPIDPITGAFGLASSHIDIPAGARNGNSMYFRWFGSGAPDGAGPVHALHMRVEDLDEPAGFSVHTLYGVGGATARDCAVALQQTSDTQLRTFFERVRDLQPSPKRILVRIAFGANDFTENQPSVGPDGPFPAATNESVADNTREIIAQINEIWTGSGWDPSELTFLLVGAHERLDAEPEGYGYRQAIADVTLDAPNIAFVNHYRLAARLDLLFNGWYHTKTGAHLSRLGYEMICRFEIDTLLQNLRSDLNGDCVVDTADLGVLINAFGGAGPLGDINGDGVVDTADLGTLIAQFGNTCAGS